MTQTFDVRSNAYKIAIESFNEMAADQAKPAYRANYRTAAMEAIAGPDAGMVIERLYQGMVSRSGINFGKIPESQGNLQKFTKYEDLSISINLLHRQLDEYNIPEMKVMSELHDNLIRCRDDFVFGYKADSQFIKTTYETMVYALLEMVNLCEVIYIDMLKCSSENIPFTYQGYQDLLLVKNVEKFNAMIRSGEWATMMRDIRKDARNFINVVFGDIDTQSDVGGVLRKMGAPIGIFGMWAAAAAPQARKMAAARGAGTTVTFKDLQGAMGAIVKSMKSTLPGRVALVVISIIAALLILRSIVSIFYSGVYSLRDILNDNATFLKAHMDRNADATGTSKSIEKQKWMYERLSGLRDGIERRILAADKAAKKDLKESNAKDFTPDAFQPKDDLGPTSNDADFSIG